MYLCRGSDCRKDKLRHSVLEAYVGKLPIVRVPCQKICKAPIVGVDLGDGPRWFMKMNSSKALSALKAFIASGVLESSLKKRESRKRKGHLRA